MELWSTGAPEHGSTGPREHGSTGAREHRSTGAPEHGSTRAREHGSTGALTWEGGGQLPIEWRESPPREGWSQEVACLSACLLLPAVYVCCFDIQTFQRFKHFKHSNILTFKGLKDFQTFKDSNIQTSLIDIFKHRMSKDSNIQSLRGPTFHALRLPPPTDATPGFCVRDIFVPKSTKKQQIFKTASAKSLSTARGGDSPLSHGRKTRVLCPQHGGETPP